jgi:type I restriction-modification system DNA methylase subunit
MIPQTFDEALERVRQSVVVFKENETRYLSHAYSEAQARLDFIDKFWVALGWDVNHEQQTNPYEQEVKVERGVAMSAGRKRADYAFFAPNFRDVVFYVEAKKPQGQLESSLNYFQTIRYGWNSQTPLAVITDFEQFHILDCRYKPNIEEALQRVVKKFHYTDYADAEKFREIYYLFSREAVTNGKLQKFADSLAKPSGKAHQRTLFGGGYKSVDESFLQDLDEYRQELARAFAKRNHKLNSYEITEVTQRTLDRLVFMRFLEDKMIEPEPIVESLGTKGTAWQDFVTTSHRLDAVYNGIIFKKHFLLDSAQLKVDLHAFEGVRESFAPANSPYDFNAIPIHILGSIYEQFLGRVITVTDKGATVEEKPEVRKAGGVYYTPEYIVRYIVANTVGKLIHGKTPEQVAGMRFADIACGSGSFLLGVYDLLLRHHTKFYNRNKGSRAKGLKAGCVEREDGTLQLSLLQRRNILLHSIFGVDIDPQAVEVAQLSLYLKLLEDETVASSKRYQMEFREALLPSLNKNIICGNSLIDWDVAPEQNLFEPLEERDLNPFSYEREFHHVMSEGGFDAVVGNPPYGAELTPLARDYLTRRFKAGTTDTAALMMLQAIKVIKKDGQAEVGLIVPKSFAYSSTWEKTRDALLPYLDELIDVNKVWKKVKLEQVICLFNNENSNSYRSLRRVGEQFSFLADVPKDEARAFSFYVNGINGAELAIGRKLLASKTCLGDFTSNTRGGMFQNLVTKKASERRVIGGKQLQRYGLLGQKGFVRNSEMIPDNAHVIPGSILVQNIVAHIANPTDHIKIIGTVVLEDDARDIVILDTVNQITNDSKHSSLYLLALLHSRLLNWYIYRFIYAKAIRTMHFDSTVSDRVPIRAIDFSNRAEKTKHDQIVKIVGNMMQAKAHLGAAHTDRDENFYRRKHDDLEGHLNSIVYELYGLTQDEIATVEQS